MDKTERFQCLGNSNWTICSLLSQFCSQYFQTFSPLYWRANSYYPRERSQSRQPVLFLTNSFPRSTFCRYSSFTHSHTPFYEQRSHCPSQSSVVGFFLGWHDTAMLLRLRTCPPKTMHLIFYRVVQWDLRWIPGWSTDSTLLCFLIQSRRQLCLILLSKFTSNDGKKTGPRLRDSTYRLPLFSWSFRN